MIFAMVSAALIAIAATVLLFIKVLPAKYDGTFSKKIFQKDIAEKKKNELVHSLKKTVEDTVKQLGEEKQLEIWMEEQMICLLSEELTYSHLRLRALFLRCRSLSLNICL